MRIPRIYTPQDLSAGLDIVLEEQASIHLSRVLRFQPGHNVRLFNGRGYEFSASITVIDKKSVSLSVDVQQDTSVESPLKTQIAVAVSKGEKMDLIIQKCTELGVSAIYPIITERSDVRLNEERWQKKQERWQEIAISACEQCGRNTLPEIHAVVTFAAWLSGKPDGLRCLFHPEGTLDFSALPVHGSIAMAFGSEGGFTGQEIRLAQQSGCHIARLGPRILRAETAPVAALAIAQSQWGDLLL